MPFFNKKQNVSHPIELWVGEGGGEWYLVVIGLDEKRSLKFVDAADI